MSIILTFGKGDAKCEGEDNFTNVSTGVVSRDGVFPRRDFGDPSKIDNSPSGPFQIVLSNFEGRGSQSLI